MRAIPKFTISKLQLYSSNKENEYLHTDNKKSDIVKTTFSFKPNAKKGKSNVVGRIYIYIYQRNADMKSINNKGRFVLENPHIFLS